MDAYNTIIVIFCIALFVINLVFSCFTCFTILYGFMTETNQDLMCLRETLLEPEHDVKVMIVAVSNQQGGFSDSIVDDCGQDCSHDICAC
ncbi:unnamed protein product [Cochlearia groenlandica]